MIEQSLHRLYSDACNNLRDKHFYLPFFGMRDRALYRSHKLWSSVLRPGLSESEALPSSVLEIFKDIKKQMDSTIWKLKNKSWCQRGTMTRGYKFSSIRIHQKVPKTREILKDQNTK